MSDPHHDPADARRQRSLDELAAIDGAVRELIDGRDGRDPVDVLAGLPSAAARHDTIDHLLVDALLARSSAGGRHRERRQCEAALEALRREQAAPVERAGRRFPPVAPRTVGRLLVALAALVGVVAVIQLPGRRAEASAYLEAAIEAVSTRVFRTYTVTVEHASESPATVGRLAVCGGRRFTIDWPSAIGRFEAGSDGHRRWIVPPIGPVLVSSDDRRGGDGETARDPGRVADLEYLSLAAILERVKTRYRVDFATRPGRAADGMALVATHASAPLPGEPERIEIRLAGDRGVPRSVVLHFPPLAVPTGPRRIEFALDGTREPTPADDAMFQHPSHHAPDRPVLAVPFLP